MSDPESPPEQLPHWQLESIFPGLDSDAYAAARAELAAGVDALARFVEDNHLGADAEHPPERTAALFEEAVRRFDEVVTRFGDLRAFLNGFVSTDAFNDRAQAEQSSLTPLAVRLSSLDTRLTAWLGGLDQQALLQASPVARERAYALSRAATEAGHLMSDAEEDLAAALNPSGGGAFARLHASLISRHTVTTDLPGRERGRAYTVAELKNLQGERDPELRRAAYEAELELLERDAVSYAAAMNAVKGEVGELAARRGWDSPLDAAVFQAGITREALEAMQTACRERFPLFRRYLRAKAQRLGKPVLHWSDLFAPLGEGSATRTFSWPEAKDFVVAQFRSYSDALADFAEHASAAGWIDVPPRKGKRNGAFCMAVPGRRESRVMLNFGHALDDVFTLAHELGHAYHDHCIFQAERDAWQRATPVTLAETASIFCETIVTNAMLERASEAEQLAILEQDLQSATQLVLDIDARFRFERAVFDKRRERELSIDEFKALMLDAQAATYGDALAADGRHPLMWAHKGHYYSTGRSFYNYPYTFGYLFGLGLYAEYRRAPDGFADRYDRLLASTGMADAATLARDFGIDIEDPDFWRASLDIAAKRVERFEQLAARAA